VVPGLVDDEGVVAREPVGELRLADAGEEQLGQLPVVVSPFLLPARLGSRGLIRQAALAKEVVGERLPVEDDDPAPLQLAPGDEIPQEAAQGDVVAEQQHLGPVPGLGEADGLLDRVPGLARARPALDEQLAVALEDVEQPVLAGELLAEKDLVVVEEVLQLLGAAPPCRRP
jgi:hypothetical protein